jgi:hypothetical protein
MGRNCTQRLDWRAKMRPRVHLPPPEASSNLLTLLFPLAQRLDGPAGHVVGEEIHRFGIEGRGRTAFSGALEALLQASRAELIVSVAFTRPRN